MTIKIIDNRKESLVRISTLDKGDCFIYKDEPYMVKVANSAGMTYTHSLSGDINSYFRFKVLVERVNIEIHIHPYKE